MAEQVFLDDVPLRGDELLTPDEARAVLGISGMGLWKMADSGRLPWSVRTLGGYRRYLASDVLAVRSERRRRTRRAVRGEHGEDEAVA